MAIETTRHLSKRTKLTPSLLHVAANRQARQASRPHDEEPFRACGGVHRAKRPQRPRRQEAGEDARESRFDAGLKTAKAGFELFNRLLRFVPCIPLRDFPANHIGNANHESITPAESPLAVGHARVSPSLWKLLQRIQLVWDQASVAAIDLDHVLEARCPRPSLASQYRARRIVKRVRKSYRALGGNGRRTPSACSCAPRS